MRNEAEIRIFQHYNHKVIEHAKKARERRSQDVSGRRYDDFLGFWSKRRPPRPSISSGTRS